MLWGRKDEQWSKSWRWWQVEQQICELDCDVQDVVDVVECCGRGRLIAGL